MIKINATEANGYLDLKIEGHAKDKLVCCAVSTLSDTIITMLEILSNQYPNEITFNLREEANYDKKNQK